ncbi:MAG: helix-turn-helix domain-containing protein [Actinobacteria bacterium]|nr:helix-turn-helix domain-containing protein [Actinomycetota bacterium]
MTAATDTASQMIREMRAAAGLSQAELARRAGLTRSVVNAYEHGTRQPGADALARIAAAAGMQLSFAPRVAAVDPVRAGRLLEQVLGLAEALPHKPSRSLGFPGLHRPAAA